MPPEPAPIPVRIYEVAKEWSTFVWLCDPCVDGRKRDGWRVSRPKLPPPRAIRVLADACPVDLADRVTLTCDDCGANCRHHRMTPAPAP